MVISSTKTEAMEQNRLIGNANKMMEYQKSVQFGLFKTMQQMFSNTRSQLTIHATGGKRKSARKSDEKSENHLNERINLLSLLTFNISCPTL